MFQRLEAHGLKLQPEKGRLFQRVVRYLGHVMSQEGVTTNPEKSEVVHHWMQPVRDVRSFLGFVGYYRQIIPRFAWKAGALHGLLHGVSATSHQKVDWMENCQWVFEDLRQALVQTPVLACGNYTLPFCLYMDASLHGLGPY